jgi:hypothetical protein
VKSATTCERTGSRARWQRAGSIAVAAPGVRSTAARMIELAGELIGRFPELGFAGNFARLLAWSERPIVLPT